MRAFICANISWFGVCSFFGHYLCDNSYGKFKISVAIPKWRTLPRSLIRVQELGKTFSDYDLTV